MFMNDKNLKIEALILPHSNLVQANAVQDSKLQFSYLNYLLSLCLRQYCSSTNK